MQRLSEYEKVVTLLKTRESKVANPGAMKPSEVKKKICSRLGLKFTVNDHARCWKHFEVRPLVGAPDPTKCNSQYCQYDEPHKDYIYAEKWVDFLVSKLSDPATYKLVLGREPGTIKVVAAKTE